MLVLSRNSKGNGESVIAIGDDILVEVLEIRGDKVRIGITAPRETRVMRTELLDVPPKSTKEG